MQWLPHFLLTALLPIAGAQERDWVSADGRPLKAALVGVEGRRATLRLADGRAIVVALEKLSEGDRSYVETWRNGRSAELALPPVDWPAQSTTERPKTTAPKQSADGWEFKTPHFLFSSDAELGPAAVQELATVAEATWKWSRLWPVPPPEPTEAGGFYRALLFQHKADYEAAGGPKDSAGFFRMDPLGGGRGALLVPIESLGLEGQPRGQVAKGWSYDPRVLIHEISHQLTADYLNLLPLWIREGLAEWASLPLYRNGTFLLGKENLAARLRTRWEDFLRRDPATGELLDGKEATPAAQWTIPLQTLWDKGDQLETIRSGTLAEKQRLYFNSLLCTYYFLHLEGDGNARRFRVYWQAVDAAARHFRSGGREGSVPPGTQRSWDSVRQTLLPILTEGKPPDAWQQDMVKKYAALGLRLAHAPPEK